MDGISQDADICSRESQAARFEEEEDPSAVAQTNFTDLPNEIIVYILGGLEDDEDLYRIGLLSRRMNFLSLPLYLSRKSFGSRLADRLVLYDYNALDVLKALNAALFKPFLTRLHYPLDYDKPAEELNNELRGLRGVVEKLSSLQEVTFNFHGIPSELAPVEVITLLDSILSRRCQSLEILYSGTQTTEMFAINDSILGQSPTVIEKLKDYILSSISPFLTRLGYPSNALQGERNTLRTFFLHSPILFHPLLLRWTIRALANSDVNALSISQQLWVDEDSWELVLPRLMIPTLTQLVLDSCSIRLYDLVKFFKRHRSIRKLYFGSSFIISSLHAPYLVGGLSMPLTHLSAPLNTLVKLLDSKLQVFTSSLRSLTIPLRIQHGECFNLDMLNKPLETAFWLLKPIKEVRLVLSFEDIPSAWILPSAIDVNINGNRDGDTIHSLITHLDIHVKVYTVPFSSALKTRALVIKFPTLTHLTIRTMSTVDCSFEFQQGVFTRLMKETCPLLESVSFA